MDSWFLFAKFGIHFPLKENDNVTSRKVNWIKFLRNILHLIKPRFDLDFLHIISSEIFFYPASGGAH